MIITIITLVVLSAMLYTLGSKLLRKSHRNQYIIDYQNARYACDSAAKYALALIGDLNAVPIARPNEPDFSDLFQMSQEEYDSIIEEFKLQLSYDPNLVDSNMYNSGEKASSVMEEPENLSFAELVEIGRNAETSDMNLFDANAEDANAGLTMDSSGLDAEDGNAFDNIYIRGPYGPKWPLVKDSTEFEIGTSKVVIEIEDENAKLPLTWALMDDEKYNRQAQAAVKSFLQSMKLSPSEIETLQNEFNRVKDIKAFSVDMNTPEITTTKEVQVQQPAAANQRRSRASRRSRQTAAQTRAITEKTKRGKILNFTDFSKISNSLLMNTEILQKPAIETIDRTESAYKYIGFWGEYQVNINTAPRHVLEAAFTFGGDEVEIADAIIQLRKIKPFNTIEELSKALYQYNDTIEKSKPYIITRSNIFTVRITAYSGTAKASAIAAVLSDGRSAQNIIVILE